MTRIPGIKKANRHLADLADRKMFRKNSPKSTKPTRKCVNCMDSPALRSDCIAKGAHSE